MLHTYLTTSWHLRYPIIGAPMAGIGRGRLARAVSEAGGLGMIGIGSTESVELIAREAAIARGTDQGRFGIGLMAWAIESRPELLDSAIEASPFLIAISFGSPAPYVERLHQHGILLATQVHSHAEAVRVAQAGVDLIVTQGAEAGGHHTRQVSTLPLLQSVLDSVQVPTLVAGGIASPRGVAAALAAGAEGVWVGTCLLASPECENTERARSRIVQAQDTDTILTRAFDVAQGLAWPPHYPGRALRNRFTDQWDHQVDALAQDRGARQQLAEAIAHENYDLAHIYAGEAVGMVRRQRPAGEVIQQLGDGAERLLRGRFSRLLAEPAQEAQEGQAILADLNNFATGGVAIVANEEEVLVPFSLPSTPQDWKHHLVQDHFGAAAQAYTTSKVHARGPDLAWIVEAAALTGKEHVVDVGTGTGHTALALAPYATEVVALDITLPMLEEARHLAASRGVTNVRFLQGDACALPLNSSQFDLVACRYAAHHFTHLAQAIGEWARILKTGGKVVVADSVSPEEPEIDRFLNEIEVLRDPSHGRNYRISEWFSLLAEAGFTASLVRSWTLPLDLASWTQRIQTPPASVAQIERLFADASSLTRERLHIGLNEKGLLSFALPAAVIVGVKSV